MVIFNNRIFKAYLETKRLQMISSFLKLLIVFVTYVLLSVKLQNSIKRTLYAAILRAYSIDWLLVANSINIEIEGFYI